MKLYKITLCEDASLLPDVGEEVGDGVLPHVPQALDEERVGVVRAALYQGLHQGGVALASLSNILRQTRQPLKFTRDI